MKKFTLVLMAIGLIFSSQTFAQVKFGMKVGGNLGNMKFDVDSDYGDEPETKSKLGYHIGFLTDITLIENTLSLQPALQYSNKGYNLDFEKMLQDELDDYDIDIDDYKGHTRFNYRYIELPINVVYKLKGFQFYMGPYIAVGLGGSYKVDFSFEAEGENFESRDFFDEDKYKLDAVFGKVDDDRFEDFLDDDDVWDLYRAIDYGLNVGVGYQVSRILFNVGYSLGLANMTPAFDADNYDMDEDFTEGYIQKNRVLTFSVAIFFN